MSTITLSSITQVAKGKTVVFQTKNERDQTTYRGVLKGQYMDYSVATDLQDIDAYHQDIQRADPNVRDAVACNYFIVDIIPASPEVQSKRLVFADEWILPGTLTVVEVDLIMTYQVHAPITTKPSEIINLLKSAGFTTIFIPPGTTMTT